MKKKVVIYADHGAGTHSLRQLVSAFKDEFPDFTLTRVRQEELKEALKSADLLAIPGGRDIFYHQSVQEETLRVIRNFIQEGGGYLGICAGAYFASDHILFDLEGKHEVRGERHLKLIQAIARGPVYGGDEYHPESDHLARVVPLKTDEAISWSYFYGGCEFDLKEEVQVIAKYQDSHLQGKNAIVAKDYGKGKVVLSGVHPEFSCRLLSTDSPPSLRKALKDKENSARALFKKIVEIVLGEIK